MPTANHLPVSSSIEILMVEDSPTQAMQLRGLLERNGYQVIEALNPLGRSNHASESGASLERSHSGEPQRTSDHL